MSYQAGISEAVVNAGRFLKEGGMDSVKLEGGQEMVPTIDAFVNYREDVSSFRFPAVEHTYSMEVGEEAAFLGSLAERRAASDFAGKFILNGK